VAAVGLLTTQFAAGNARRVSAGCKPNYDYAGENEEGVGAGIRVNLTNLRSPGVGAVGHVAGWVGVGGPGLGPNGTDEWIQLGYAGFAGGNTQIYYEVTQPNLPPKYHLVQESVPPQAKYLMAVTEVKKGAWQASINGKPVSPVIALPGSHGKFSPQAIGETWNGGTRECNAYAYGFVNVEVAATPGGSTWRAGKTGSKYDNAQQKLVAIAANSFITKSAATSGPTRDTSALKAAPVTWEPPLMADIASSIIGHKVATRCVPQSQAVTAQPDTILVNTTICQILIGYAVAEPRVPAPYSPAGLLVAKAALDFLRGIAKASGTVFPNVDCGALTRFYQGLRPLGVTSAQSAALRKYLLHASIPLYLPNCPVH
jgi:hypothetical protein